MARAALIVTLFVGFAVLAVVVRMGDGPLVLVAFATKWLSMPFLWFGTGSIVDPGAPMLQPTDMLVTRERVVEPVVLGRRGALALTAFGAALYVAAVVMLLIGSPPKL